MLQVINYCQMSLKRSSLYQINVVYDEHVHSEYHPNNKDIWAEHGKSYNVHQNGFAKSKNSFHSIYSNFVFNSNQYRNQIVRFKLKILKKLCIFIVGLTNNSSYYDKEFYSTKVNQPCDKYYVFDGHSKQVKNHIITKWTKCANKHLSFKTGDEIVLELDFFHHVVTFYKNRNFIGVIANEIDMNNVDYRLAAHCRLKTESLKLKKISVHVRYDQHNSTFYIVQLKFYVVCFVELNKMCLLFGVEKMLKLKECYQ